MQGKIVRRLNIVAVWLMLVTVSTACKPANAAEEIEPREVLEEEVHMRTFTDVPYDYWAADSIHRLYDEGVMKGFEDKTFRPEDFLTEAQFVVYLTQFYQAFGQGNLPFEQENEHWADVFYEELAEYNFPFLGYDEMKKRNLPVEKELVQQVFSVLHNNSGELQEILESEFAAIGRSGQEEKILTRAEMAHLLDTLAKSGYRNLEEGTLVDLKEAYLLEQKEARRQQEEKERKEQEEKDRQREKERKEQEEKAIKQLEAQAQAQEERARTEQKDTKGIYNQLQKMEKKETAVSETSENDRVKSISSDPGIATSDLLLPSENSRPRTTDVTHVMIHFMSNAANKPNDPFNMKDVQGVFTDYGVSSHYVIDRSGRVYRFVKEDRVAFHAGKGNLQGMPKYQNIMNDYSIGIELLAVGTREEMLAMIPGFPYDSIDPSHIGYTSAQYSALNSLLNDIYKRYPSLSKNRKQIIGHDEYAPSRKTDPGELFDWTRIGF